jgi:NTP pyrophosphatase (non-canonical NTP hydrolase)
VPRTATPWYGRPVTVPRDQGEAKIAPKLHRERHESGPAPRHRQLGLRDGLEGLRDLMDRLLAPDGCPWDREQTLESLKPYLIEEAYEVLDAMHEPEAHRRELGDLLLQIVFQAALREREGAFDLDGVIAAIRDKMIRRHPHVFDPGAAPAQTPPPSPGSGRRSSSPSSPSDRGPEPARRRAADPARAAAGLAPAGQGRQRRLRLAELRRRRGEDPRGVGRARPGPRESGDLDHVREEFGDLLFVLVRYGQKLGLAAEDALRGTCAKFEARFAYVMEQCHARGIDPNAAGLAVLDGFWDEAKARGIGRT